MNRFTARLQRLAFHLLMVVVLVLSAWLSGHYAWQWDWSRHGGNSLNPSSIAVLKRLSGPLEVTAYAPDNTTLRDHIRRFVGRYQYHKPDLRLDFVDPLRAPDTARRQGISLAGELRLVYNGREERLQRLDEEQFSNALLRLNKDRERWVAALGGHGERDLLGQANHDLGNFGLALVQKGYQVVGLDLASTPSPPDNTSLLVIATPQHPFLPGEIERLRAFLDKGGNLLLMSDPETAASESLIAALTGIAQLPGTVVDAAAGELGIDTPAVALVPAYPDHPATRQFKLLSLFPQAAALTPPPEGTPWQATPLLRTLERSWNETGPLRGEIERNPLAGEEAGPLVIGYALSRRQGGREQRLLVTGDGDFLANSYLNNAGNLDLGLALVRWLTGDDPMLEIPTSPADDRELLLSKGMALVLSLGWLVALPLLLLLSGGLMAWRRNRA